MSLDFAVKAKSSLQTEVPMSALWFQRFQENRLFNFVGIGCGRMLDEGPDSYLVFSLDGVTDAAKKLLGDEFKLDHPEVVRVLAEAKEAGVVPTFADVINAFKNKELPEGYQPTDGFEFEICISCGRKVPHGHLYDRRKNQYNVTNLLEEMAVFNLMVSAKEMTPETAVFLFQKMAKTGIMETPEDFRNAAIRLDPEAQALLMIGYSVRQLMRSLSTLFNR
jgi:hypothetical protein